MYISEKVIVNDNNIESIRRKYPEGLHFVVGDTHGQKDTLEALMSKISFDSAKDHVYFVGDYNEGGSPEKLLNYMSLYYQEDYEKPGFHMIRGNHERELGPLYSLANLPDIIVVRGAFLSYYIVHAGMVSLAYEAINDDMNNHPEEKIFAYSLDEYCTGYDAPLGQLTFSRYGLYSQNSHWLKHRWPTTADLHKNHACIIHGHTPYCYFTNNRSHYGDINLFWEKQHIWFSEDLCSYNIDSNIKGRYVNGEIYRGISCVCLEVCDEIASRNQGMLTIEGIRETENGVFSAAYIPWISDDTKGNINSILNARPVMKTIAVDRSEKVRIVECDNTICTHENSGSENATIGYRYSCDEKYDVYIITVSAPNEQPDYPYFPHSHVLHDSFYSENCRCISIKNANTGEELTEAVLSGVRHNKVVYRKGEILPGKTWYVHSIETLHKTYLAVDAGRHIVRSLQQYAWIKKIDEYISDGCQTSTEELAEEMHIRIDDLQEKIEYCKSNSESVKAYEFATQMLSAGNAVYDRKMVNGEIEPGWMRHLKKLGIEI